MIDPLVKTSLKLKHTVWSDCFVANSEIIGIVIGVGDETRMKINSKLSKKIKRTKLDDYINYSTMVFFFIVIILSFLNTVFLGLNKRWYINMFRYVLILNNMIPISIKINLMFGRKYFNYKIERDSEIPGKNS